jgi:uncharacterized protein YrrD
MDHPKPELKYVGARFLNGTAARLDGADVLSEDGEKLGSVDGFIIDERLGRPRYVVVEAGWFIHKHFLLPIGHVTLSADATLLTADITKDRVKGFPGFDKSAFQKLDGDQLDELDRIMATLTAGHDVVDLATHYRIPEKWEGHVGKTGD